MTRIFNLIKSLRFLPYLIVFLIVKKELKDVLIYERDKWLTLNRFPKQGIRGFMSLLVAFPEYRSLFIYNTPRFSDNRFGRMRNYLYLCGRNENHYG